MERSRQIGAVPLAEGRELRISLTTDRGRAVLDVREFAHYKPVGLMTPNRNGVVIPVETLGALAPLIAEAAALVAQEAP